MDSFPVYILKSTICIGFLYMAFRILMSREICFSINRGILLAVIAGSMLIPIVNLPLLPTPVRVELIPDFSSSYVHIVNLPVDDPSVPVHNPEITGNEGNELAIHLAGLLKYNVSST